MSLTSARRAGLGALAIVALSAGPAGAATPTYVAQATAQAVNLDVGGGVAAVALPDPATAATNDGTQAAQTSTGAPDVSLLSGESFLAAGALSTTATAEQTGGAGTSFACAGVVQPGATVDVGTNDTSCASTGTGPGGVTLDLNSLPGLGTALAGVADVSVSLDAVTAFATEDPTGTASGSADVTGGLVTISVLGGTPETLPLTIPTGPNGNLLSNVFAAISGSSNPTVSALGGTLSTVLSPLVTLTTDYQPATDSVAGDPFTVTGLHVALLGSGLGTADLATVTVGPNAEAAPSPIVSSAGLPVTLATVGVLGAGVLVIRSRRRRPAAR